MFGFKIYSYTGYLNFNQTSITPCYARSNLFISNYEILIWNKKLYYDISKIVNVFNDKNIYNITSDKIVLILILLKQSCEFNLSCGKNWYYKNNILI